MKILDKVKKKRSFEADEIRDDNKKYLSIFEDYLKTKGYNQNLIDDYLYKVNLYINDYILKVIPIPMEEACSLELFNFVKNVDDFRVITPIKIFYECMTLNGFVKQRVYKDFLNDIEMFEKQLKTII